MAISAASREFRIRRATQADSECADRPGVGDSAEHIGSPAACGNAGQRVAFTELVVLQVTRCPGQDRPPRARRRCAAPVATRDDPLHQIGRRVEGGWALGGIENPKAAGSAGTQVEQAAAGFEATRDPVYRTRNVGNLAFDGGRPPAGPQR